MLSYLIVILPTLRRVCNCGLRDVTIVSGCILNQGTELYLCSLLLINLFNYKCPFCILFWSYVQLEPSKLKR